MEPGECMCSTNKEFGLCEVGERVSRGRLEQISVEKEAGVMRCSARERNAEGRMVADFA